MNHWPTFSTTSYFNYCLLRSDLGQNACFTDPSDTSEQRFSCYTFRPSTWTRYDPRQIIHSLHYLWSNNVKLFHPVCCSLSLKHQLCFWPLRLLHPCFLINILLCVSLFSQLYIFSPLHLHFSWSLLHSLLHYHTFYFLFRSLLLIDVSSA